MQGWTRKDEVGWASPHSYGGHTGVLDSNVPFAVFTGILPFVVLAWKPLMIDFCRPRFYLNDVSLAILYGTSLHILARISLSSFFRSSTIFLLFFAPLPDLDVSRLLASGVNTCK
jgi:hypothetical protein